MWKITCWDNSRLAKFIRRHHHVVCIAIQYYENLFILASIRYAFLSNNIFCCRVCFYSNVVIEYIVKFIEILYSNIWHWNHSTLDLWLYFIAWIFDYNQSHAVVQPVEQSIPIIHHFTQHEKIGKRKKKIF